MSELSPEEVKKIAHLARIELAEKDADFYAEELSAILQYIEQLNSVDTEGVEPAAHITGLHSIYRKDELSPLPADVQGDRVALLRKAVPFFEKGYVKVKSVFGNKV